MIWGTLISSISCTRRKQGTRAEKLFCRGNSVAISNMSGVQPFQFEPTHPPGEELVDSEEERDQLHDELVNFDVRVGNIE